MGAIVTTCVIMIGVTIVVTVKPDVLLLATLQTSVTTLVFDWQFESSKLQLSLLNLFEQVVKFQFSFWHIKQGNVQLCFKETA